MSQPSKRIGGTPGKTLSTYRDWLGRFLKDHPNLLAGDLTVETFAKWKMSLRDRGYSSESINHYLSAVRAKYTFGEDTALVRRAPRLKRVKNESLVATNGNGKPLYTLNELNRLLDGADMPLRAMVFLALNCGFGPKGHLRFDVESHRCRSHHSATE